MSNLSRWYQLLNESFLDLGRQFEVGARVSYDGRTGGAGQVEDLLTAGAEQGAGREYPAEGIVGADRVDNRYWVETFFERGFCIVQLGSFGAVGDGKAVEVEALDKAAGLSMPAICRTSSHSSSLSLTMVAASSLSSTVSGV